MRQVYSIQQQCGVRLLLHLLQNCYSRKILMTYNGSGQQQNISKRAAKSSKRTNNNCNHFFYSHAALNKYWWCAMLTSAAHQLMATL